MNSRNYFRETKKHCNLKKKLFLATKHSNLKGKKNLGTSFGSQPFLKSCYFTKIFVHLSVITAVCYFSVYTQQTFTCSKSTSETLEKGMKYAQS